MKKGHLFVVSGPSGVGKSTAVKALLHERPEIRFSVSATTRPIRPGEIEGESYYFVTKEGFEQMLADGALLEHAQ